MQHVTELLSQDYFKEHIDDPIDAAVWEFELKDAYEYSHQVFHELLTDFVQHVYRKALPCQRELSRSQAHGQAILLLMHGYVGARARGYSAALADALDPDQGGVPGVLAQLAEIMKARLRGMHVRWVISRYFDSADWETQCSLAYMILDRCGRYLPAHLRDLDPEYFASNVDELFFTDFATDIRRREGISGYFLL
jgi:hypothetical protein